MELPDPLEKKLRQDGYEITECKAFDTPGSTMMLGKRFVQGNAEIIYKMHEPEVINLVIYRLLERKPGMANQFLDMLWLPEYIIKHKLPIKRILGAIKPLESSTRKDLPLHKLTQYYKNYLGCQTYKVDDFGEWVYLDISQYKNLREYRSHIKQRK